MSGQRMDERGLEPLEKIPIHGFINGIAIGPRARFCVAAVGQEPRLGRWDRVPRAKNRLAIISLRTGTVDENEDDELVNLNEHERDEDPSEGSSEGDESSSGEE